MEEKISDRQQLLKTMLRLGLNPKATLANIPEWQEISKVMAGVQHKDAMTVTTMFLILRGIRGQDGVRFTGGWWKKRDFHCTDAANLHEFATSFVAEWEHQGGGWALSHRESLHHLWSGVHYARTLLVKEGHALLIKMAQKWEPYVGRALSRKQLLAADLIQMTKLAHRSILMKIKGGKQFFAQRYNIMDFMRGIANVFEQTFGAPAIVYTEELHNHVIDMQATKYRNETRQRFNNFGLCDASRVNQFISDLVIPGCNWTTILVVMCETKQAINKLGEHTLQALVTRACAQPEVTRDVVLRQVASLLRHGVRRVCATVLVLDALAKCLELGETSKHQTEAANNIRDSVIENEGDHAAQQASTSSVKRRLFRKQPCQSKQAGKKA